MKIILDGVKKAWDHKEHKNALEKYEEKGPKFRGMTEAKDAVEKVNKEIHSTCCKLLKDVQKLTTEDKLTIEKAENNVKLGKAMSEYRDEAEPLLKKSTLQKAVKDLKDDFRAAKRQVQARARFLKLWIEADRVEALHKAAKTPEQKAALKPILETDLGTFAHDVAGTVIFCETDENRCETGTSFLKLWVSRGFPGALESVETVERHLEIVTTSLNLAHLVNKEKPLSAAGKLVTSRIPYFDFITWGLETAQLVMENRQATAATPNRLNNKYKQLQEYLKGEKATKAKASDRKSWNDPFVQVEKDGNSDIKEFKEKLMKYHKETCRKLNGSLPAEVKKFEDWKKKVKEATPFETIVESGGHAHPEGGGRVGRDGQDEGDRGRVDAESERHGRRRQVLAGL